MNLPRHVQTKLIADGLMDETRVTHNARPNRCPRCKARTIAGIDDLGGTTHVQPNPTTTLGEAAAVLTGRRVWTILSGRLVHRGTDRISRRDADTEKAYPAHTCHAPPLPPNPKYAPAPPPTTTDAPPY